MLSHICRYYYKYLYGFEASLKEIAVFEICMQYDGKLFPLIFHLFNQFNTPYKITGENNIFDSITVFSNNKT